MFYRAISTRSHLLHTHTMETEWTWSLPNRLSSATTVPTPFLLAAPIVRFHRESILHPCDRLAPSEDAFDIRRGERPETWGERPWKPLKKKKKRPFGESPGRKHLVPSSCLKIGFQREQIITNKHKNVWTPWSQNVATLKHPKICIQRRSSSNLSQSCLAECPSGPS